MLRYPIHNRGIFAHVIKRIGKITLHPSLAGQQTYIHCVCTTLDLFFLPTTTDERLRTLFFAQHLRLLRCEGSLVCHTYCDKGYKFKIVIPKTCDTHTYCRAFKIGFVTICFNDLSLPQLRFENLTSFYLKT